MKQFATKVRPKHRANRSPAAAYLALIDRFPLRPLRSERDYDQAAAILDTLAVRPEGTLDRGEQDYFDTLTMLVEAYDAEHYADLVPGEPLALVKYLMHDAGGPGPIAGQSCPGVTAPQRTSAAQHEAYPQAGGPFQGFPSTVSRCKMPESELTKRTAGC
jgi:hypothetical protein